MQEAKGWWRVHESYDASAGQHRTRAGNAGDGTATTASGAGRAPVNGLPSAASGLEALLDELDAAMSATAGTCAGVGQHHYCTRGARCSCVHRVPRL